VSLPDGPEPSLATEFCGIELANPLINGSGTLDALVAGTLGLAAFVSKTVTLQPREGNPPPRIGETPSGMVNSIGLANPGLDRFCDVTLPQLADLGVPLIVSVGGWTPGEYALGVNRIAAHPAVRAIELNVSCPNVESGCISIGSDAAETRSLVERCRPETDLPLLVKLSPNVADIGAIGAAAAAGGANGLVVVNTLRGIALDRDTLQPLLGGGGGGLSGAAIKPVGLHAVHRVFEATGLPVAGMGGVSSAQDVVEYLAAGAAVVGIGTALFADPSLPLEILAQMPAELGRRELTTVSELVGRAHNLESQPLVKLQG
jgi:dihydroorotate dehydrogenase (NAD+) catalytic subunit